MRGARTSPARCRAPGSVCCDTTDAEARNGLVLTPAASRAARDTTHPHHHQGQLARHGPPRRVPRLHLDQDLRRPRGVRRGAALPRPLRLRCLQRRDQRHPARRRPRSPGGAPAHRPQPREPLGQGHPPDPRDLPPRRALPDERGAACSRWRRASCTCRSAARPSCSCAATSSAGSCPASSTCRATATTRRSGCGSRRSCSTPSAAPPSTTRRGSASPCSRGCTSSCACRAAVEIPDVDAADLEQRIIDAARTWDEDLSEVLSVTRGAEGAARAMAALRQGAARGLQGGLRRRDRGRGPRPDRRTRPRRQRHRAPPLPGRLIGRRRGSAGSSSTAMRTSR